MSGLGRGKWRAYAGTRNGKAIYSVWTDYRDDLVCIVPGENMAFGYMALQLTGGRRVPTKLDHVRYALSEDGDWTDDVDENSELDVKHCHLLHEADIQTDLVPPTECTVSLGGDLSGLSRMLLGDFSFSTTVRIGLIDGDWGDRTGLNNNSHFLFLPVDGFGKAWGNMQILMNPACAVLRELAGQGDKA